MEEEAEVAWRGEMAARTLNKALFISPRPATAKKEAPRSPLMDGGSSIPTIPSAEADIGTDWVAAAAAAAATVAESTGEPMATMSLGWLQMSEGGGSIQV